MAVATTADFVQALNSLPLLTAEQKAQLPALQQQFPDLKGLAQELIKRRWLTLFQANQVAKGKSQELVLDQYIVLDLLGQGGSGQVFKARHQKMHRFVALKVLRPDLVKDDELVQHFHREIEAVSHLSHPNLVHAYEARPIGERMVLAMEYIDGPDLERLVQQCGTQPFAQACEYTRQVTVGLQYVHEHGLVHRDIKPSNLLVTGKDHARHTTHQIIAHQAPSTTHQIKILDLGLVRFEQPARDSRTADLTVLTGNAVTQGTPDYMAPEQALDFHGADTRADIYSLGCTLYYLLTGQPPFPGGTLAQKLACHQQAEPTDVNRLLPSAPAQLAMLLRRMLAKRPEDRYQTPGDVGAAIASLLGEGMGTSVLGGDRLYPVALAQRRRFLRRLTVGGLLLAATGLTLPWLLRSWRTSPLEKLDRRDVPRDERAVFGDLDELVAVLGQHHWRHWGAVLSLALSPDGRLVATGGNDATIRLWDRMSGQARGTLKGHTSGVALLVFTPDGREVASVQQGESTVRLWDLSTGQLRKTLTGHKSAIHALVFAPPSRLLITGSADMTIKTWETATGRERATLTGHTGAIASLAMAPDGKTLASAGSTDRTVKLWDLDASKELKTLSGHQYPVRAVAVSPDGKTLASAAGSHAVGDELKLWAVSTGTTRSTASVGMHEGKTLAFVRDDRTLVIGSAHRVKLWDLSTGKERAVLAVEANQEYLLPLVVDGPVLITGNSDGTVRLWDIPTGKERGGFQGHAGRATAVAFAPDGRTLISASADGTIRVWDLATLTERRSLPLDGKPGLAVVVLRLTADGKTLASLGRGGLKLWDPTIGLDRGVVFKIPNAPLTYMAMAADGQTVASGHGFGGMCVWDARTGSERFAVKGTLAGMGFSPDGKLLAAGVHDRLAVKMWDVATGKEVTTLLGHKNIVQSVTFSPDGQTLVSGSADKTVKLWDVGTETELAALTGPAAAITCVSYAPNGQAVMASDQSGKLILWDAASKKPLWECQLPGAVNSVAFAPDSRHLATANANGTVSILRLPSAAALPAESKPRTTGPHN